MRGRAATVTGLAAAVLTMPFGCARAHTVEVTNPRPFGYFLGDRVERVITVVTDPGEELVLSALPQTGPQAYWLDLISAQTHQQPLSGGRVQSEIQLVYQIFYSSLEPHPLDLPSVALQFRGQAQGAAAGDARAVAPTAPVIVSPLREIVLNNIASDNADKSPVEAMQPDAAAEPVPMGAWPRVLVGSLVALLLAGTGLLYHYALWPFVRRPGRPFARAAREVSALAASAETPEQRYRAELISLHRAFDEAFGRRLLASDIDAFLVQRSEHAGSSPEIKTFLEGSRYSFFGDDPLRALAMFGEAEVLSLSQRLAREERGSSP